MCKPRQEDMYFDAFELLQHYQEKWGIVEEKI